MCKRYGISIFLAICLVFSLTGGATASPDTPPKTYPGLYSWSGKTIENAPSSVGAHTSIAFDPGTGIPFISYYDATAQTVKLASTAMNSNCGPGNTWWCRAISDPQANVGKYSSIDVTRSVNGDLHLGIAYINGGNRGLRFAEYACSLFCHWTYEDVYVDTIGTVKYPSFKYGTDTTPHISFYVFTPFGGGLVYASRVSGTPNCVGSTTWQCWHIDSSPSGNSVGWYSSLALNSSNKARISYYDTVNHILKYAVQSVPGGFGVNCGPATDWVCRGIDPSSHDQGLYTSLVISPSGAENPHIAYYDKTSGYLKHAYYVGSGGNCGLNSSTLQWEWRCDDIIDIGAGLGSLSDVGISIALDANKDPVIAYMDASDVLAPASLGVARPNSATGNLIGNCGPAPVLFQTWTCQSLDGGGSYTNEADYASIAINPSGLAYIAYSETDDYNNKYNLKIVYQQMKTYLPSINR